MIRGFFVIAFLLICCAGEDAGESRLSEVLSQKHAEKWSDADNPSIADDDLVYEINALPSHGSASPVPWPGPYWDTVRDAFNFKWDYTASPVKKYESAFGLSGLEDLVSRFYGVDQLLGESNCSNDAECNETAVYCGQREGVGQGYCIPEWWGYCHAWSLASIVEPEPKQAVTVGGVVFRVNDIKALITMAYDDSKLIFLSNRCDLQKDKIVYENNRPIDEFSQCRDTNPGTFHVMLGNYLGIKNQSFAVDMSIDYQVWNSPVRGYNFREIREISRSEAVSAAGNFFDSDTEKFYLVDTAVNFVIGSSARDDGPLSSQVDNYTEIKIYQYILEVDGSGRIVGGEWIGESKNDHPDFLRLPQGPGTSPIALGKMSYYRIKQILNASSGDGTADLVFVSRQETLRGEQSKQHGPFEVAATSGLEVEISGEGSFDLYVHPMGYSTGMDYVCKKTRAQTGKRCLVKGPGKFSVKVSGHAWYSRYRLSIFYGRN